MITLLEIPKPCEDERLIRAKNPIAGDRYTKGENELVVTAMNGQMTGAAV